MIGAAPPPRRDIEAERERERLGRTLGRSPHSDLTRCLGEERMDPHALEAARWDARRKQTIGRALLAAAPTAPADREWMEALPRPIVEQLVTARPLGKQIICVLADKGVATDGAPLPDHETPACYVQTFSMRGRPVDPGEITLITATGRVSRAERMPDGQPVTVNLDSLARRREINSPPVNMVPYRAENIDQMIRRARHHGGGVDEMRAVHQELAFLDLQDTAVAMGSNGLPVRLIRSDGSRLTAAEAVNLLESRRDVLSSRDARVLIG